MRVLCACMRRIMLVHNTSLASTNDNLASELKKQKLWAWEKSQIHMEVKKYAVVKKFY